jgi:hypothetical protein
LLGCGRLILIAGPNHLHALKVPPDTQEGALLRDLSDFKHPATVNIASIRAESRRNIEAFFAFHPARA